MSVPKGLYLIAGASGAIGRAICHRIVSNELGIPVLIGRSTEKLQQVQYELQNDYVTNNSTSASAPPITIPIISNIDFTDPITAGKVLTTEIQQLQLQQPIHGLVYAVGSISLKPLRSCLHTDYIESYNVNVLGAIELIKASLNGLKVSKVTKDESIQNTSSIVLFSSVAVQHGFTNHSIIGTSKGGVEGLTKSLAAELVVYNIRVNCIAPSLTSISSMGLSMTANEKIASTIASSHPLSRLGTPADSANLAYYLLNNQLSSWMTGTILPVDGGRSTICR